MKLNTAFQSENLLSPTALLVYLSLSKLVLHLFTMSDYGIHRDEFLYLAMGDHLDWGYLEVPPSIAFMAALVRKFLGDSIFAIRLLPVIAGTLIVFYSGLMTREFGGGRFALALAALAVVVSPAYLRSGMLFMPVVFDQLYWVVGAYVVVKMINHGDQSLWFVFGVLAGIALLNKYTMLLFGFGVFVGLLFSPQRKWLAAKHPWQATLIALAIFLPNLIWQHIHGWPFFEHMQALSQHQFVHVQTLGFLVMQFLMNLFTAPIWMAGLYFFFFTRDGSAYRTIGWIYVTALTVLLFFSGKAYYLLPAYPLLFAGGAVLMEKWLHSNQFRAVLVSFVILGNALLLPYGIPLLPVESLKSYVAYMSDLGLQEALRWEDGQLHELPQEFADMFGWEEQVASVAEIYRQLMPEDRQNAIILAANYGEAGAIDFYRHRYALPPAVSFNGSYFLWGPSAVPLCSISGVSRDAAPDIDVVIAIHLPEAALRQYFSDVQLAKIIMHEYARESRVPVYLCRYPKVDLAEIWPKMSEFRF